MKRRQRLGAYAVVRRGPQVLLSRLVGEHPLWFLPGGGVEHGEDPRDAAVREVREETGYDVRLDALLAVDSLHRVFRGEEDHHGVRVIYAATIVGGELRFEENGSSDRAEWFGLDVVEGLTRASLVDIGLAAATRPPGSLA